MFNYMGYPQFLPETNVISLVNHSKEVQPGTPARIVSPWFGSLCVVKLPDGNIHRWFAWFELKPSTNYPSYYGAYSPGSYATVINNIGHGNPPHIEKGTEVRIVKCIPYTVFYDVTLMNGEYHRWLAEFELAEPI